MIRITNEEETKKNFIDKKSGTISFIVEYSLIQQFLSKTVLISDIIGVIMTYVNDVMEMTYEVVSIDSFFEIYCKTKCSIQFIEHEFQHSNFLSHAVVYSVYLSQHNNFFTLPHSIRTGTNDVLHGIYGGEYGYYVQNIEEPRGVKYTNDNGKIMMINMLKMISCVANITTKLRQQLIA